MRRFQDHCFLHANTAAIQVLLVVKACSSLDIALQWFAVSDVAARKALYILSDMRLIV
jgi:hypothetical protein